MSNTVIVDLPKGKIRGVIEQSRFTHTKYYTFYGIPYGQPPINDLRFKDPVEVKHWKSIRDGTKPRGGALQFSMKYYRFCGSEDCLYVNVHTLKLPSQEEPLRPIIVLIHPGGYTWGSPDPDHNGSPDYFMHHDIVYVTIGYRLGALGFLNLGLQDCSGNQGLKDIIMALQWIHNNIHFFNGDATNITLIGSSSAGTIINLLMLSPAVKGLFHKAVMSCGYPFNPIALESDDGALKNAIDFGKVLGYQSKSRKGLLQYFKSIPAAILQNHFNDYNRKALKDAVVSFPLGAFGPSIDKGKNAVLPVSPRKLIPTMERIPVMFGICEHEGVMGFTRGYIEATEKHFKTAYLQNCWSWTHGLSPAEVDATNQEIEIFYMKDIHNETDLLRVKNDIITDAAYSDLYETLIDVVSSELPSSVFVYKFEYVGEVNPLKKQIGPYFSHSLKGTFHADDISYWSMVNEPKTDETKQMIHTFTKLITTFAYTGNPNFPDLPVKWKPSTPPSPCYLSIKQTLEMVDGLLNGERMKFWHNLKKKIKSDKTI